MSEGIRSGVNWIRENLRFSASATDETISVFASPGTPTSSACPPERSAARIPSSTSRWPTIRRPTCSRRRARAAASRSSSSTSRSPFDGNGNVLIGPQDTPGAAVGSIRGTAAWALGATGDRVDAGKVGLLPAVPLAGRNARRLLTCRSSNPTTTSRPRTGPWALLHCIQRCAVGATQADTPRRRSLAAASSAWS